MKKYIVLALAMAAFSSRLEADDSWGILLPNGQLAFAKSEAIHMVREQLSISISTITVDLYFINRSTASIEGPVIFPLPDYSVAFHEANGGGSEKGDALDSTIKSFRVWVDGHPVKYVMTQQKIEGTDLDKQIGLYAMGHTRHDDPGSQALVLRTQYHWVQRFPPGKLVHIRHTYAPLFLSESTYDVARWDPGHIKDNYCTSPAAIKEKLSTMDEHPSAGSLDYVLMSARNWAGPIDDFELSVELPKALALFTCQPLEKAKAGEWKSKIKNFVPQGDLHFLFFDGY